MGVRIPTLSVAEIGIPRKDQEKINALLAGGQFPGIDPVEPKNPLRPEDFTLSDDDKHKLASGMAQAISTTEVQTVLNERAQTALDAIVSVRSHFDSLLAKLTEYDDKYTSPKEGKFAPRLATLEKKFNGIVSDSKTLAVEIAAYGEQFDQMIIPFVNDTTKTKAQKVAMLQTFIDDAQNFSKSSRDISADFDTFLSDFARFTGSFNSWAQDKEADLDKELKTAKADLAQLQKKLEDIQKSMIAFGVVAGATLPVTGIIAAFSGPAAPAVIAVGCIIGLVSVGIVAGLAFGMNAVQGEIRDKENKIAGLEAQLADIRQSRIVLENLGQEELTTMRTNVGAITQYWQYVSNQATEVQSWLKKGADVADEPTYLKIAADHSISIYTILAKGLRLYSDGHK